MLFYLLDHSTTLHQGYINTNKLFLIKLNVISWISLLLQNVLALYLVAVKSPQANRPSGHQTSFSFQP